MPSEVACVELRHTESTLKLVASMEVRVRISVLNHTDLAQMLAAVILVRIRWSDSPTRLEMGC
jgi:hypothetical protein